MFFSCNLNSGKLTDLAKKIHKIFDSHLKTEISEKKLHFYHEIEISKIFQIFTVK